MLVARDEGVRLKSGPTCAAVNQVIITEFGLLELGSRSM